jgi:hypothetical protein
MFVITKIATTNQYGPVQINEIEYYGIPEYDPEAHGTDVIARSVPNVPNTDFLEVYYDGQDYTSMPSTITDKSGNGVTGTPSGVSFDSTWKAFSFDGSGDVITNTRSGYTGSGVYTASTWVNVRKEAAGITFPAVFQYGNGQSSTTDTAIGLAFRPDGAIRPFIYGNNDLDVYGHKQYNTWTHCTAIYMLSSSETKITLYINGEEVGFNSTSTGAGIGATPHLCIGAQANNSDSPLSSTYLHGSIANFRLFNRALTGDEIWQLYAYQKDYFQVSPDVVTFKGGRLGIGTSEPRAVLDVQGSAVIDGIVGTSPTGGIIIPSGTTAQQPTGQVGMVRFNTSLGKLQVHDGNKWLTIGLVSAAGGTVTYADGYTIHTFTTSDDFVVYSGGDVECLVVAGGGAGGTDRGGGGGAGGMLTGTYTLLVGSHTITVGGGASAVVETTTSSGTNSSIGSLLIAIGGGGGGGEGGRGANGGSGGGSGYGNAGFGSGTSAQGNRGGSGYNVTGFRTAGGGGGAGGPGKDGSSDGTNSGVQRPDGGPGIASSINGTSLFYAGGGGGGRCDVDSAGANTGGSGVGGSGVGGNGAATTEGNGYNGTSGRGGGGGGGARNGNANGGSGGDGIVIIRYLT